MSRRSVCAVAFFTAAAALLSSSLDVVEVSLASMEPTIHDGDYVVVVKRLSPLGGIFVRTPGRETIVVLCLAGRPGASVASGLYLKRVVRRPGRQGRNP